MKKIKGWKHEKEFDTRTLILLSPETEDDAEASAIPDDDSGDQQKDSDISSKETRKAVDLKDLADAQNKASDEKVTQVYEPRPLTPDDDIYEDIIEQFASAPTKPKYWFEEFGDYWSCSCGHINKGDRCKSCGLERELLRSLFILHKPAGAPGKLNKKLSKAAKELHMTQFCVRAKTWNSLMSSICILSPRARTQLAFSIISSEMRSDCSQRHQAQQAQKGQGSYALSLSRAVGIYGA